MKYDNAKEVNQIGQDKLYSRFAEKLSVIFNFQRYGIQVPTYTNINLELDILKILEQAVKEARKEGYQQAIKDRG